MCRRGTTPSVTKEVQAELMEEGCKGNNERCVNCTSECCGCLQGKADCVGYHGLAGYTMCRRGTTPSVTKEVQAELMEEGCKGNNERCVNCTSECCGCLQGKADCVGYHGLA